MGMKTLYFKEHDRIVHNPMGQLAWWNGLGLQSDYGDCRGQLKPIENPTEGACAGKDTEQKLNKGTPAQFTIFPGDGQKRQAVVSLRSDPSEHRTCFGPGFHRPMVCEKYPYIDQCYGLFSTYGPQVLGRLMLPLNLATEEGPIYVNPKQYNGIIRRRQSRAKAVLENKVTKARKPYMHHSRHLHALRRPRGCGGRFLNTKASRSGKDENEENKGGEVRHFYPTGSQDSEVLQSDNRTLKSPKEAANGTLLGSEVSSMYSRGDFEHFPINHHLGHTLAGTNCHWVAESNNLGNLKL